MRKFIGLIFVVLFCGCGTLSSFFNNISNSFKNTSISSSSIDEQSTGNPSFVRQGVDYTIRDSVDRIGNQYISFRSQLPSIFTFINNDGTVTICSSDERNKISYVYEYSADLTLLKTLHFNNQTGQLGAFTKDNEKNYYFFYGENATNERQQNMFLVKYDADGNIQKTYILNAYAENSFNGINKPFDAGTCRMEISGSMLCVYFAREMFISNDGLNHQASYGFIVDKDTFMRLDSGQVTNSKGTPINRVPARMRMPYVSHSFNQFVLPIEDGFIIADHGDAFPRSFVFAEFKNGTDTKSLKAFTFSGRVGENATYAQMGGLAKTSTGYIFSGIYGRDVNNPRNVMIITFGNNLARCSSPVYITSYTNTDGHAGHPKIVSLEDGRYLLLWEKFRFSTQPANQIGQGATGYQSTFMVTIDQNGKTVSEIQELRGIRLNMNDVLRYNSHNKKVYWAINNSSRSITVYALEI